MPTAGDVGVDKYLVIEILAADHKYLLWLNLRFIKLLIHFTKLCPERFGSAPASASQRGVVPRPLLSSHVVLFVCLFLCFASGGVKD